MFELEKYSDRIAVVTNEKCYSYHLIDTYSKELSSNIPNRSTILIICDKEPEAIFAYIMAINNRHVVMMMPEVGGDKVSEIVEKYRINYVFFSTNRYKFFEFQHEEKCVLGTFVLYSTKFTEYNEFGSELALLLSTSGTTGNSKFVRISYTNILSNTNDIVSSLSLKSYQKECLLLPIAYSYGLSIVNTRIKMGGTIVIPNFSWMDKRYWNFYNEINCSVISQVPFFYRIFLKMGLHNLIQNIDVITCAGDKLGYKTKMELWEYSREKRCDFYYMYGQTEATARITCVKVNGDLLEGNCVGRPIGNTKVYVSNEDEKYKYQSMGQIVVKGPQVSMGYAYSYEDLMKGDENQGTLETGDYGYFDNEKKLYVDGRRDSVVKLLGKRIELKDVERYLLEVYGQQYCCKLKNGRLVIVGKYCLDELRSDLSKILVIPKEYIEMEEIL